MIKQVALFVFCAAFLIGCAAPTKTIKFDSEPRGARVFQVIGANEDSANKSKGRNFLGVTPFDWTTEVNGDGTFQARSTAVPFYSDFVQRGYLRRGAAVRGYESLCSAGDFPYECFVSTGNAGAGWDFLSIGSDTQRPDEAEGTAVVGKS
jgi:hypothetical protein